MRDAPSAWFFNSPCEKLQPPGVDGKCDILRKKSQNTPNCGHFHPFCVDNYILFSVSMRINGTSHTATGHRQNGSIQDRSAVLIYFLSNYVMLATPCLRHICANQVVSQTCIPTKLCLKIYILQVTLLSDRVLYHQNNYVPFSFTSILLTLSFHLYFLSFFVVELANVWLIYVFALFQLVRWMGAVSHPVLRASWLVLGSLR